MHIVKVQAAAACLTHRAFPQSVRLLVSQFLLNHFISLSIYFVHSPAVATTLATEVRHEFSTGIVRAPGLCDLSLLVCMFGPNRGVY